MKREIELDFVRGIAILMVLDFHSPKGILFYPFRLLGFQHFGWAGVDIFFVLSGFLVGGLLIKEWKLKGRINSKVFLIRRGFKIWPQYYLFIVLMLLTGHRSLQQLWGNLLNVQNYVGGVAHTWSLAVEEHAYIILVLLLAVAAILKVRMKMFFFFLIGMTLSVIVLRAILAAHGHNVFSETHTRIDGILEGVLLATLYHYAPETFRRLQRPRWLWLSIIVAAIIYFRLNLHSPIATSLTFDCANAMGIAVLMLFYRRREGKKRPALYRFVAWIGLYSYGIYLWHVSVVEPAVKVSTHLPHWFAAVWIAVAPSILGVIVGIFFTKIVEFPALALRDKLFPRPIDSAVGVPAEIEAVSK
ncbi:acyltransferase family protein [Edaphobacter modestus]|uniref:Peptidoglycan/LPS O-acetylase OafA/YrhL n=1 Tax=Edaphobacter modestus TaxID=388466 RepID=A0A4Q7YRH3_9BACT|nr:acyltransferase [Edaphobacter modestus]RZU39439.1 peptidoglycan/LPS O-acetylase OafA/YrhL [Edaphobacter modestus]